MTRDPVTEAGEAALAGHLVVFPTDTVYGLATRPDDPDATSLLFDAKGRASDLALPVLVSSTDLVRVVAELDERAERLAHAFWPGALTLVLPRSRRSGAWKLGGDGESIGVRVPAHPLARAVLTAAGPLAVSSANRSGNPPRPRATASARRSATSSRSTSARNARSRARRPPWWTWRTVPLACCAGATCMLMPSRDFFPRGRHC